MPQIAQPQIATLLGKVETKPRPKCKKKRHRTQRYDALKNQILVALPVVGFRCAFALMRVQMDLAQTDRVWRNFNQFIRVDIRNRLFQ